MLAPSVSGATFGENEGLLLGYGGRLELLNVIARIVYQTLESDLSWGNSYRQAAKGS